jgi:hypothetical protein
VLILPLDLVVSSRSVGFCEPYFPWKELPSLPYWAREMVRSFHTYRSTHVPVPRSCEAS